MHRMHCRYACVSCMVVAATHATHVILRFTKSLVPSNFRIWTDLILNLSDCKNPILSEVNLRYIFLYNNIAICISLKFNFFFLYKMTHMTHCIKHRLKMTQMTQQSFAEWHYYNTFWVPNDTQLHFGLKWHNYDIFLRKGNA